MEKKVLIISTSLRTGGNSDTLAEEFAKGAVETGNIVEKISLKKKEIQYCRGCLACQNTKECVINDDMKEILEKMLSADVLVFATPIYFYEMSGQMKTFLDRTNPLYVTEYKFRGVYLIAAAAEEEESAMDGAVNGLKGWIECFEKTRIAGVIRGTGVVGKSDMKSHTKTLQSAYEMGKNI